MAVPFIVIECVLAAFFLLSFLISGPAKQPPAVLRTGSVIKWFLPAGRILCSGHKKMTQRALNIQKQLKQLHPSAQEKQLYKEFRAQRAGELFALLLLCNSLLVCGLSGMRASERIDYRLPRPLYTEQDRSQILLVSGETFADQKIAVEIPRQLPTREQADQLLNQAEQNLSRYFQSLSVITGDILLPAAEKAVQIRYSAEEPFTIQSDSILHLRQDIKGQWEQEIQAELTCGSFSKIVRFRVPVSIVQAETAQEQIEDQLRQNQISRLGQTIMELPQTVVVDGNEETLIWRTPDERKEALQWIVFLWGIPFCVIPLRRQEIKRAEKIRKQRIQRSYPVMLHQLTVLLGAGLSITAAWDRIAADRNNQNPLIEEMRVTMIQMHHGMAPQEALREFGRRSGCQELRQLANMLCRNLRRGDEFLLEHLKELNNSAWEEHKKQVKIQSEEADTKLLIPMMIMMVVVLIIVLTPALLSMHY